MFVVPFFCDTLISNNIPFAVMSVFKFSTDQSAMSLLNLYVNKTNKHQELLSDWLIYLTVI